MKRKYRIYALLIMIMLLILSGCSGRNDKVTADTDEEEKTRVDIQKDAASRELREVADNTEGVDADKEPSAETEKVYLEEKDYELLMASVGDLAYMARTIDTKLAIKDQKQDAMLYMMDYIFAHHSSLPVSTPEKIPGDPNGKMINAPGTTECQTLPAKDVLWGLQYVFGLREMTLDDLYGYEYLGEGLCSNYYIQDDICYYYCETESWSAWGEELVAGYSLESGDIYFKIKIYDLYTKSNDFYMLARLNETENGGKFWSFKQVGFEPLDVDFGETSIVEFKQPFDDSYEQAYIDFMWSEMTSESSEYCSFESRYQLIYLNDDEIPELLISEGNAHVCGVHLFAYVNGAVKYLGEYSSYGGFAFVEREGKVCSSYVGMGYEIYHFFEYDDASMKEVVAMGRTMAEYEDVEEPNYTINGKKTTKENVEKELENYKYSSYALIPYEDFYSMDLYAISVMTKRYNGVVIDEDDKENTTLEWIRTEESVTKAPEVLDSEKISEIQETNEIIERADYSEETGYSEQALVAAAENYYYALHGTKPPHVVIDSYNGDDILIHLYDVVDDHTSTYDWYTVNRYTGKGFDIMGNEIKILD